MVEVIWTTIPFIILIAMAYPATKAVIAMKDTSASDMTVKVTGYQWKWEYDYQQDGFKFMSVLSTPVNSLRTIRVNQIKAKTIWLKWIILWWCR